MGRKTRIMLLLTAATMVLMAAIPSEAASRTLRYDTSSLFLTWSPADPVEATGDETIAIGGVEFAPIGTTGSTTVVLTARDDAQLNTAISISACQDLDNDSSCGEETGDPTNPLQEIDEPHAAGCAGRTSGLSLPGARRNAPITVFVRAYSTGCQYIDDIDDPNGPYIATSGTVTITFS